MAGILQNDMTLRSDIYLGGQTLLGHTKEMLCGDFQIIQWFRDTNLLKIINSLLWTQLFEFDIKWKFERNENFWGQYIVAFKSRMISTKETKGTYSSLGKTLI